MKGVMKVNWKKVKECYEDVIRHSRLLDNAKWFLKQELKMDEEERGC